MKRIDKYIISNIVTAFTEAIITPVGFLAFALACVGIYFISSCIKGVLINPVWLLVIGLSIFVFMCIVFFAKIKWRQNK